MTDWMDQYVDWKVLINLDNRPDRLELATQELDKVGIDNVYRFPAIQHEIGISGCTRSHYEVIKIAKEEGFKNVLIFEDDIYFSTSREEFRSNFSSCMAQIELNQANPSFLYLGGNLYATPSNKHEHIRVDANLYEIVGAKTTHAYIVFSNAYDTILENYSSIDWDSPKTWKGESRKNIDYWYLSQLHHNAIQKKITTGADLPNRFHRIYGIYPSCAGQREDYSNILNRKFFMDMPGKWNSILGSING